MARLAEGLVRGEDGVVRCSWGASHPDYVRYHDEEWGFPVADDRRLFEKLCLEGFQSGLSWLTILKKRESFRAAFRGFDFEAVARFGARDVARLLKDAGIVRHRGKIESTINNARRARELREEAGSLAAFFWSFEPDDADRPRRLDLAGPEDDVHDAGLDRAQQGAEEAGLHVRRPHHGLRLHAGDGPRQRPRRGLRRPRARREGARAAFAGQDDPRPVPPAQNRRTLMHRPLSSPPPSFSSLPFQPSPPSPRSSSRRPGKVEVSFSLGADGAPLYSVSFRGKPVVADSRLGLTLRQTGPLASGLRVVDVKRASRDETYTLVAGKTREARDRCEEMTVALERPGDKPVRLDVVFRAFDDGAAFRYVLPKQPGLDRVEILSEDTRFRFLADHRAWVLELPVLHDQQRARVRARCRSSGSSPSPSSARPSRSRQATGSWSRWPRPTCDAGRACTSRGSKAGTTRASRPWSRSSAPLPSRPDVVVRGALPLVSPWRVLMLGAKPGELVESTILTSLADPSEIGDTSWIKPGKVAWDWWNGPPWSKDVPWKAGMNDETFRHFIDFAAEFGLEYVLVDAGWYGDHRDGEQDITRPIPEMDIPALVAYGREKNVGILLWLNWECVRDQMDVAFPLYEKWGVKGVKVDYMNRKDQEIVAFYQRTLRTAAKHRLAVDFHGAYAGSGEERTFPNLLTREGVLGLEYVKWSDRVTARHDVTLPFTRMLVGPMDYTPGGFRSVNPAEFAPRHELPVVMTTRAHQLAMYVVYDSPLQMLSDTPAAYRGEPGAEFLKAVPATWDETRVLDGRIGEYVVIARRRGAEWFVGAMTDAARKVAIPLGFLGARSFDATIWADTRDTATNPNRLSVLPARLEGRSSRPLELSLAAGGGAVLHLRPAGAAGRR